MTEKRRVLLTGAAGRIGTAFWRHTGDRYRLRLGVHRLDQLDEPGSHEVMERETSLSDLTYPRPSGAPSLSQIGRGRGRPKGGGR